MASQDSSTGMSLTDSCWKNYIYSLLCYIISYFISYIISHYIIYHIISYHTISYHIMPCHVMSCHVMSCHIISYYITLYYIISYHIMSYHIISYYITLHYIISYHIISYHISYHHIIYHIIISYHISYIISYISHHITSHHITSHHIISYHIILYYIILYYIILYYIILYYIILYYIIVYYILSCLIMLHQQGSSTDLLSEIHKEGVLNVFSVFCALRQNYSKFRSIIYEKTVVVSFWRIYLCISIILLKPSCMVDIYWNLWESSCFCLQGKIRNISQQLLRNAEDFFHNIRRRTRKGSNWSSRVCSNRINIRIGIIRKTLPLALHQNIFRKYRAIHFAWSLPAYMLNDTSNDGAVPSE